MDYEYIRREEKLYQKQGDGLFYLARTFKSINAAKKHTSKMEKEKKGIVRRWNKELDSLIKV